MTLAIRSTVIVALLICAACASVPSGGTTSAPPIHAMNVITADELKEFEGTDLLSAIRKLRPEFLNTRGAMGPGTINDLSVYVNGNVEDDGIRALSRIPVAHVIRVRKLTGAEAQQEFGGGMAGAIAVTTH